MASFAITHERTMNEEGGFSARASDPGGYTYKGLTKRNFPNFKGWPRVEYWVNKYGGLSKAQNKTFPDAELDKMLADFYKKTFWDAYLCDFINDQFLASHVYDFCFNSGQGAKIINQALNLSNVNKITKNTVAAINSNPLLANNLIYTARLKYVKNLTMTNPRTKKNVTVISLNPGLLTRIDRFKNYVSKTIKTGGYAAKGTAFIFLITSLFF